MSKKIALFISHIYGEYQRNLSQGIVDKALEYGYQTEVYTSNDGEDLGPRQFGEGPDPFVNDMDVALYIAMSSGLFGDFGGERADSSYGRAQAVGALKSQSNGVPS